MRKNSPSSIQQRWFTLRDIDVEAKKNMWPGKVRILE
jgi:hypothetical protein